MLAPARRPGLDVHVASTHGRSMDTPLPSIPFDNSYARLPDGFFARVEPTPVAAPALLRLNVPLVRELGLDPDALAAPGGVATLAGNALPDGAEPLAMAYAGHQFGNWVPQLGDGRAILLGEVVDRSGVRRDVQLKGAGRTPFSRGGDGRGVARPGAARVRRRRGDGRARRADDAGAGGRRERRDGAPRAPPARRRADPRGEESRARRHLPVLHRPRRRRRGARARRARRRTPLPARPSRRRTRRSPCSRRSSPRRPRSSRTGSRWGSCTAS